MSMKYRTCILSIFIFASYVLSAAETNGEYFFQHLTEDNGLSNLSVSSIVQDYKGFLWFGTLDGLNKYDGKTIVSYVHDPYKRDSLPNNKIQTIKVHDHDLLIGTFSGLSIFNIDTGTFKNYSKIPGVENSLSNNVVISLLPDDGKIWIGTLQGLNRLDPETDECKHFLHDEGDPSSISNNVIRALYKDSVGRVWIGTYNGLDCFNRKSGSFIHYKNVAKGNGSIPSNYVMSIAGGNKDSLWVGTWGGGLSRFSISTGKFTTYSFNDNRVYVINARDDERIMAGTWGGGLFFLNSLSGRIKNYISNPSNKQSISHNIIYSILRDTSGLYWIGTKGGGVNKLNITKKKSLVLHHDKNNPHSLAEGDIYSIFEDSKGYTWISVENNGLDRWDPGSGKIKHFRQKDGLPNNTVTVILQNSDGKLIAGTLKGLVQYNYALEKFASLTSRNGKDISFKNDRIYTFFQDSSGRYWVGTYDDGCYLVNQITGETTHFIHEINNKNSISDNLITSFLETKKGIWVGTNEGLNCYNEKNKNFYHYYLNPDNKTSISSNSIRTLFLDSKNRMWIGTLDGGLNQYNEAGDSFYHYMKEDGFSGNRIQGILEDNNGRLWCATTDGITIFYPESKHISTLDESDGLPDHKLNYGVLKSKKGDLYFSSSKGISKFSGIIKDSKASDYPVYITGFKTLGKKVHNYTTIKNKETFTIPYSQNTITFKYICLDYKDPLTIKYFYFLKGVDKDWVDAGNTNSVLYPGLSAGTYTFRVRACENTKGTFMREIPEVIIHVKPPVWRSWWAQAFYDILIILLLYLLIKINQSRKLKIKMVALESLKNSLVASNKHLRDVSTKDNLTGLYNRSELKNRIVLEIERAKKLSEPLAVFTINIDFFKDFNKFYGRSEGDSSLVKISEVLLTSIPTDSGFAARYGGDEFFVVMPNYIMGDTKILGLKLLRRVHKLRIEHKKTGLGGILTISIGGTSGIPDPGMTEETFIKTATDALYQAKHEGRNKFVYKNLFVRDDKKKK